MPKPKTLDERLIALIVNASGAREVFSKIKTSEQIEDIDVRHMFDAAYEVYERSGRRTLQVNPDVLIEELKQRGVYNNIDPEKLERCLEGSVDRRNDLAQTVTAVASRKVDKHLKETLDKLKNAEGEEAIRLAAQAVELRKEKAGVAASKIIPLDDWTNDIDRIWLPPDCVSTGFPIWDERLGGGFIKGNYHLFVGHTGTGKSIMTLTLFMNMIKRGTNAAYFNYEIPFDYFRQIMFSQITGSNPFRFQNEPAVKEAVENHFLGEITKLHEGGKLNVTDPAHGASAMWNEAEDMMRDIIESTKAEIIFFDTINSVSAKTTQANAARWNEYEFIAVAAERLAMEYNVAIVFTAQPKQEAISREDKTPQLMDVGGGRVLTEKAASVTHLHRTDILDPTRTIDFSELHITKNRVFGTEFGNTPIRVKYDVNYKKLYELEAAAQTAYCDSLESAPDGSNRPPIPPMPGFDIGDQENAA